MLKRRAFTLVELLTVLAIISILSSMILPSLARAREGGRRTSCSSNLRQIGMAVSLYTEDYDERYPLMENVKTVQADLPIPAGCPTKINVPVSWAYSLDSYIKNDSIFICPSVSEPVEKPSDGIPTVPLWDDCIYPSGGGGGHGGGGGPQCPPTPATTVPRPTYAFNTMMKHKSAWEHTDSFKAGQGFGQAHTVETDCPIPPSREGTTSGVLSHTLGVHAASVMLPSETIMIADAESRDGKAPQYVNFTNDQEMDFPTTPPTGDETLSPQVFLAKRHLGGYNALFADGHTKFLTYGRSQAKQWTVEED